LSPNQIKLAKLMHDQNPMNRAELPALVMTTPEVDTYLWMERLSRDSAPAVRAASARAISTNQDQRLNSLLKEIAEKDADASVQQIARYYAK
jgi:hypothetical protein